MRLRVDGPCWRHISSVSHVPGEIHVGVDALYDAHWSVPGWSRTERHCARSTSVRASGGDISQSRLAPTRYTHNSLDEMKLLKDLERGLRAFWPPTTREECVLSYVECRRDKSAKCKKQTDCASFRGLTLARLLEPRCGERDSDV